MKYVILICLLLSAGSGFCQQRKVIRDTLYKSVSLNKDDNRFLALKDTAQKLLQTFITAVKRSEKGLNRYRLVVKSDFVEKDDHEHMWSEVNAYSNGVFKAIFIDSPFTLKNIKTGIKVNIFQQNVEDWAIYNANGELIAGSFSEKYLDTKQ